MGIQYAAYNDDNMEAGKFYLVQVNKDLASALIEVDLSLDTKHEFINKKYFEVEYTSNVPPVIQVWEKVFDEGGVLKCNLINCSVSLREDVNKKMITMETTKEITGFIVLK